VANLTETAARVSDSVPGTESAVTCKERRQNEQQNEDTHALADEQRRQGFRMVIIWVRRALTYQPDARQAGQRQDNFPGCPATFQWTFYLYNDAYRNYNLRFA